jgi:hypothetical protein
MDPYTSTRWDSNGAYIDLTLDNEDVVCGSGCVPTPNGTTTFLTLVGLDEVYKINQGDGTFNNTAFGGTLQNWAYGGWLLFCGVFGQTLSAGAPKHYYRLSYRKGNSGDFTDFTYPISDTRVDKFTLQSEVHQLGPQPPIGGTSNLYEIRDTGQYYWYNPDKLGWWNTEATEDDEGLYTVRLEVFDQNGVKLTSAQVDYRDGTDPPPGPLPAMLDRCDVTVRVDNKPPVVDLQVPLAGGACGVVKWADVPALSITANVTQENGRLNSWSLSYVKGLTGVSVGLGGASSDSGLPTPSNNTVSAAPMTAGLTGTCAFALTLGAWPLVRNGFGAIHYKEVTKAIAIEKCS